jgi:predicted anti-sigma-YlaC factor YlaD
LSPEPRAFCDDVLEAIEPIAAGDLTPSNRVAEHLSSCRECAATLESARRVDSLLRGRPAPAAPAHFTSRVMSRIRRMRWRREQLLDWGFNASLVAAGLLVVVGVWVVLRRSGLTTVGPVTTEVVGLFSTGLITLVRRISPSLPLYAGAAALLGTALGVWWWAEKDTAI